MHFMQGRPGSLYRLNFFHMRARYCAPEQDGVNFLVDAANHMGKAPVLHLFPLPLELRWLHAGGIFFNRLSHL
jgi:hypothetical protein